MSGIFLGAVFWGERFVDAFARSCLASLMSPGNIPSLHGRPGDHRFLIVTPADEFARLSDKPAFRRLSDFVTVEWIEMPPPGEGADKMRLMSRGHSAIVKRMYEARAVGSIVYPDTIYSDGALKQAARRIDAGASAVLVNCPRLANEVFHEAVLESGALAGDEPRGLVPRELVGLSLDNLHSEMTRYEWRRSVFAEIPVCPFWRLKGRRGLIMHSFIWAPMLLDYGKSQDHDTETLEGWTIDGDYVNRNFFGEGVDGDIYAVTDSDEMMLASYTAESDLTIPNRRNPFLWLPIVGPLMKRAYLHEFYIGSASDPLKRALGLKTCVFRTEDLTPADERMIARTHRLVDRACRPQGVSRIPISAGQMLAAILEPSRRHHRNGLLRARIGNLKAQSKLPAYYFKAYVIPWIRSVPSRLPLWRARVLSYFDRGYLARRLRQLLQFVWRSGESR
jgi:hypothetical protein